MNISEIKKLSKEEFMKLEGANEMLYDSLQKSQPGFISIKHRMTGEINYGYTEAFGEGLSVRMSTPDRWYITSVIDRINWDEQWFKTMNSIYDFEFKPMSQIEKENIDKSNNVNEKSDENKDN